MSYNRRSFLQKLSLVSGAMTIPHLLPEAIAKPLESARKRVEGQSAEEVAKDESFWYQVMLSYTVSPLILNMNNGGVSPQPRVVQEVVERLNVMSNELPSMYMWRFINAGKEPLRGELARLAGCDIEEVAVNRNASEALETVIFGLRLKRGDEVVLSKQDYPNMINAWKQRAHRDGIVLKWVDFEVPCTNNEYLVQQYNNAFTSKTKVVHITHMINWTGQVLPVRGIADAAKKRGIEVLVDGAHSFAQLQYKISELNCDYFGTSLHKWLCAPFGTGMLYVRKEKIKKMYPLLAAPDPEEDNIRKFENLGTRSIAIEQAIGHAINFHEYIGADRKEKRLFYLKNYWAEKAAQLPGVQVLTPLDKGFSGAIGLFSIAGMTPVEVLNFLYKKPYRIHASVVDWENIQGVRITPNVYTLTKDLDRLLMAIKTCIETK
ncbi:MAG: selenocysteine lyase/cysteine desulfurase [Polaribacter sp.]|jgi:selenocysteine lyase/cysteine desulfurase